MEDKKDKSGLSRRDFMRAAGVTAAGVMASSLVGNKLWAAAAGTKMAPGRVIGANDRINYAHIGIGGMGGGHVRFVKNLCGEQNLAQVAVCDVWEKRRQWSKDQTGVADAQVYSDYRKCLENKDIDVVVIATPDHWHAPIAIAAMQMGKHVYVEKPMTHLLSEAFAMRKVARDTKQLVQVGSQGCTDTKWHVAGQAVKDGKIGTVLWAQGGYCRQTPTGEWNYYKIDPDMTEATCDWKFWLGDAPKIPFSPERFFRWRKYWDYGSGIIGDLWPHRLHPLMVAMNMQAEDGTVEFPHRVACLGANITHSDKGTADEREVADTTQMIAEFPSGKMIVLAGCSVNDHGPEDMIRGNKATLFFGGGKVQIQPQGPYADEIEQADLPVVGPGESQPEHHKDLIACIRGTKPGGRPNCNIELATSVQTMVSMAEMSYRQNTMALFDTATEKLIQPTKPIC